jgi:1-deoxy-D-xylulose-5-phosphate reductoisomerase
VPPLIAPYSLNEIHTHTRKDSSPVRVCILGASGSIGRQTLQVISQNPELFEVDSLSAYSNIELIIEQIREFSPKAVAVNKEEDKARLQEVFTDRNLEIYAGEEALCRLVSRSDVEVVLNAVLGFAALPPLLAAIKAGKAIAIANKESLVGAPELVRAALHESKVPLVPVDSEHNAIYQALSSRPLEKPRRIILTASGGPFFGLSKEALVNVTPEQAATHPRWNMGMKISIDSASLMNKGLEVIEAAVLFDLKEDEIEVLIHPQSFVHGMVEYQDGSTISVCYEPDMRVPILNALYRCSMFLCGNTSPMPIVLSKETQTSASGSMWFQSNEPRKFEFYPVDNDTFPALSLVRYALRTGGGAPLVLNTANEVGVNLFVEGKLSFNDIMRLVKEVLEEFPLTTAKNYDEVILLDKKVRNFALELAKSF